MCNIPKIYNYHFINGCVPAMGPNFSIIVMSHVSYLVSVYINWLRTVPTMLSVLQRFFFFLGGAMLCLFYLLAWLNFCATVTFRFILLCSTRFCNSWVPLWQLFLCLLQKCSFCSESIWIKWPSSQLWNGKW